MLNRRSCLSAAASLAIPSAGLLAARPAWAGGQLESELADNAWLTVAADPDVIFDTPIEQRYDRALALLGVHAWLLSPHAGRA